MGVGLVNGISKSELIIAEHVVVNVVVGIHSCHGLLVSSVLLLCLLLLMLLLFLLFLHGWLSLTVLLTFSLDFFVAVWAAELATKPLFKAVVVERVATVREHFHFLSLAEVS